MQGHVRTGSGHLGSNDWMRVAVLTLVAAFSSSMSAGQAPSVADGVYSAAQAERGRQAYARSCQVCHGADLYGNPDNEVPALVDDEFLVMWEKSTVGDLMARVSRTMPGNRPGSLPRTDYLDIIAFLLKSNRFPAGPADLPDGADALSRLAIRRP